MTEREKQLDKMNDKLAERNGVLILENMGLKAQVKNFKFDRDNLKKRLSEAKTYKKQQIWADAEYGAQGFSIDAEFYLQEDIVELTDSELKENS